jgi:hypothetical protein
VTIQNAFIDPADATSPGTVPPLVVGPGDTFIYQRRLYRMLGYALLAHGFPDNYIVFEPVVRTRHARPAPTVRKLREMNRLPLCWPYEFKLPTLNDCRRPAACTPDGHRTLDLQTDLEMAQP